VLSRCGSGRRRLLWFRPWRSRLRNGLRGSLDLFSWRFLRWVRRSAGGLRFDERGQLRLQKADLAFQASNVIAQRTGCVLAAQPEHEESNRQNNDEEKFHTDD
jgi:hypothetical protein